MNTITLADLRNPIEFFKTDEILHIVNGRKKEDIGFFVPIELKAEFLEFLEKIESKKRAKLLKKIAEAQKKDPIDDGAVADGLH
ncbi:MAG: hypothetical protein WCR69_04325 [Sulfuricurvum sp.]